MSFSILTRVAAAAAASPAFQPCLTTWTWIIEHTSRVKEGRRQEGYNRPRKAASKRKDYEEWEARERDGRIIQAIWGPNDDINSVNGVIRANPKYRASIKPGTKIITKHSRVHRYRVHLPLVDTFSGYIVALLIHTVPFLPLPSPRFPRAPGYSNFDDRSPRMFVSPLRPACVHGLVGSPFRPCFRRMRWRRRGFFRMVTRDGGGNGVRFGGL